jgi:hypothetical protein
LKTFHISTREKFHPTKKESFLFFLPSFHLTSGLLTISLEKKKTGEEKKNILELSLHRKISSLHRSSGLTRHRRRQTTKQKKKIKFLKSEGDDTRVRDEGVKKMKNLVEA